MKISALKNISAAAFLAAASFSYADTLYFMQGFPSGNSSSLSDGACFFDSNDVSVAKKSHLPTESDTLIFANYEFNATTLDITVNPPDGRYYDTIASGAKICSLTDSVHNGQRPLTVENLYFSLTSDYKHRGNNNGTLETTPRKDFGIYAFCEDLSKVATNNVITIKNLLKVDGGKSFSIRGKDNGKNYLPKLQIGQLQMTDGATLEGYKTSLYLDNFTSTVNLGVNETGTAANGKTSLVGENTYLQLGTYDTARKATGDTVVNLGSIDNKGSLTVATQVDTFNSYGTFNHTGTDLNIEAKAANFYGDVIMKATNVGNSQSESSYSHSFVSTNTTAHVYGTLTVDNGNVTSSTSAKRHYNVSARNTTIEEGATATITRTGAGNVTLAFTGDSVNNGTIILSGGTHNSYLAIMDATSFKSGNNSLIKLGNGGGTIYFANSNGSPTATRDTYIGNVDGAGRTVSRGNSYNDASVIIGTDNVSQLFDANLSLQNGGNSGRDGRLYLTKQGKSWQRIYGDGNNYTGTTTVNDGALFLNKVRRQQSTSADNGLSTVVTVNGGYFGSAGSTCILDGINLNGGKLLYNFEFGNSLQITMKDSSAILSSILASDFAFANASSMIGTTVDLLWFDDKDVESIGSQLQSIIDNEQNGKYEFVDVKTGNTYYAEFSSEDPSVFSVTLSVPEPSTWAAIFGALALAFAIYRRRK
ncbi:MAG: PEP-CTERM sorting domain-containing protein [Opitutales bacterium]|nr:PEP-CTERM sorting domain-containing protein [Opitutales bacterium]